MKRSDIPNGEFDEIARNLTDNHDLYGIFMLICYKDGSCEPVLYGPEELHEELSDLLMQTVEALNNDNPS